MLIEKNKLPSSDMGVRDPPPPLRDSSPTRNRLAVSQNAGLTFPLYQNFDNHTHITKRMPVLIEHPSRGEEGDSTRTKPVSI